MTGKHSVIIGLDPATFLKETRLIIITTQYVWSRHVYAQDLDSAVFRFLINPK